VRAGARPGNRVSDAWCQYSGDGQDRGHVA
jgi:hypothetical protein